MYEQRLFIPSGRSYLSASDAIAYLAINCRSKSNISVVAKVLTHLSLRRDGQLHSRR